jgi:hypothetical protein
MSATTEKPDLYLSSLDNYNKTYEHSCQDVFNIFSLIINNYLNHCIKTIYIHDKTYLYYVIENGLNILYSIFSIIYLYSKNIELTKQYTERGYYMYCEFIGKIGDNNHKFLQLNSKDATLFVLKKTIYELNNTYTRNFEITPDEQKHINDIKDLCDLYIKCIKLHFQVYYHITSFYTTKDVSPIKTHNKKTNDERTIKIIDLQNTVIIKNEIIKHTQKILNNTPTKINTLQSIFDNLTEKYTEIEIIKHVCDLIAYPSVDKLKDNDMEKEEFMNRFNNYLCKNII